MIDLLGSARTSIVIALAGATVASPFVVKNDALAKITGRDAKPAPVMEEVVAGGYTYQMPGAWGRLGAESAQASAGEQSGTVVAGVCPGGDTGSACKDDVQITFVAYDGTRGKLPLASTFEQSLDSALPKRMKGFRKLTSGTGPSADGSTWLRYEFTIGAGPKQRRELLGAFRHSDGSGVVAVAVGPRAALQKHHKSILTFLATAEEVLEEDDDAAAAAH